MTDRLFVYGTLMRAAAASALGRDMRARLESEADWLGTATVTGRLYDRGRYPLLIVSDASHDLVHGEVYRLRRPDETFRWLDPYEGLPPGSLVGDEYERRRWPARLADGTTFTGWLYVGRTDAGDAPRIAGGSWRPCAA